MMWRGKMEESMVSYRGEGRGRDSKNRKLQDSAATRGEVGIGHLGSMFHTFTCALMRPVKSFSLLSLALTSTCITRMAGLCK